MNTNKDGKLSKTGDKDSNLLSGDSCSEDEKKTAAKKMVQKKGESQVFKKKDRLFRHDKRRSMKRKAVDKWEKKCEEYANFMNSNLEKKKNYKESPHIVIRRSFHSIKKILLYWKMQHLIKKILYREQSVMKFQKLVIMLIPTRNIPSISM